MAASTASRLPCSDASPQPYSPASVETLTNSQLRQSTQYLNVSTLEILTRGALPASWYDSVPAVPTRRPREGYRRPRRGRPTAPCLDAGLTTVPAGVDSGRQPIRETG